VDTLFNTKFFCMNHSRLLDVRNFCFHYDALFIKTKIIDFGLNKTMVNENGESCREGNCPAFFLTYVIRSH
jgi:hypothetical protein